MKEMPRYTFRTTRDVLDKLNYIAAAEARSVNKELERLVLKHIAEYEKEHGKISLHQKDAPEER